jgi:hypothetical protein
MVIYDAFFAISLSHSLTHSRSLADAYNYWNPVHEHVWYFGSMEKLQGMSVY